MGLLRIRSLEFALGEMEAKEDDDRGEQLRDGGEDNMEVEEDAVVIFSNMGGPPLSSLIFRKESTR